MADLCDGDDQRPDGIAVELGDDADRRLRTYAAAAGVTPSDLATRWVEQRLEVEEAARRAQGAGAEQLLRLVQAIEDVDLPGE